jgi:hypothetical protein
VQQQSNIASIGALVTDGHLVYALTSRHVAGPDRHPLSTVLRGHVTEIGSSSTLHLTRLPFSEVYPDFVARRTFVTLDAGLVAVSNLEDWTSQVYGLPPIGTLADLSERNISTRLINAEVVAYGAASGLMAGRIAALFFRHRSISGFDDVTDFLIAPEPGQPSSQPGDSGTMWHLRQKDGGLRPIALQWGGQGFVSDGDAFNFALASSLSNILRLLNVELVVDHNLGAQPFWGKTGHYSLATFACTRSGRLTQTRGPDVAEPNRSACGSRSEPKAIDEATAPKRGSFAAGRRPRRDLKNTANQAMVAILPGRTRAPDTLC